MSASLKNWTLRGVGFGDVAGEGWGRGEGAVGPQEPGARGAVALHPFTLQSARPDTPYLGVPVLGEERLWRQQAVEAAVEGRVLQAVAGDEEEDAVEGQHALEAAAVQAGGRREGRGRRARPWLIKDAGAIGAKGDVP